MNIIDHGHWTRYVPEKHPEGMPGDVMFCRRDRDGKDWYSYIHGEHPGLGGNSIKLTVLEGIVRAVYRDATMLFPQNCLLIEITDDTAVNPQAKYGGKLYDARTKSFSDPPPEQPVPEIPELLTRLDELRKRIETLETIRRGR
jgi:hypothetical protein